MYRFTFTAFLTLDDERFERFTASIIAKDKDSAREKLAPIIGEEFSVEFDLIIKVEEI